MGYNFFIKSNIDFGRGALEDLADIIKGYGMKSAMIVLSQFQPDFSVLSSTQNMHL